ncbi:MAG: hypothetical protein MUC63_03230, partial [Planctomycetes bacterium]|nr:hypothetical protein [Planctomycetota bacterium]
ARPRLDDKDVEEGGYLDNLATMWPKALRVPTVRYDPDKGTEAGVLLAGGDALGHFAYLVGGGYNWKTRKGRISIDFESAFFAPLLLGASVRNDKAGLVAGVPLARSLDPGVEVTLTAGWYAFDGFERHEFEPRLVAKLDVARAAALLDLRVPFESRGLGSSLDRTGLYAHGRVENFFLGEFVLDMRLVWDPDNPKPVFPTIRGYPDALPGNTGAAFTVEFSAAVLPLRGGIWNPTLYFEDVCLAAFFDAAVQEGGAAQASAGLEVRLEVKVLNAPVILFLPGVRGLVTRERETRVEPILEVALSF